MSNTSIARASVGRSIPSAPLRILDAPDLVDDYYLNLISWGHNNVRWSFTNGQSCFKVMPFSLSVGDLDYARVYFTNGV